MLHVRVIAPTELSERAVALLTGNAGVTHLAVLPGAARQPAGDVLLCDVVREAASDVIDGLKALGIGERGAIVVEDIALSLSHSADRAAEKVPGLGADAVVWEELEQKTGEETNLSVTFLVFLTVATLIAGIGVLLDQPILIVGAMVVGPEFGPLAALCIGIVRREWRPVRRSIVALAVGFPVAMVLTAATTWLLTAFGLLHRQMLLDPRPLTGFISRPDALSWIVAFLAGIAGMLSLTSAKSGALVGVLISVTTVPAAANVAIALSYGVYGEAAGSAVQFAVNVGAIATAGVLTLGLQRMLRRRPAPS